jgi:hypothetical protein
LAKNFKKNINSLPSAEQEALKILCRVLTPQALGKEFQKKIMLCPMPSRRHSAKNFKKILTLCRVLRRRHSAKKFPKKIFFAECCLCRHSAKNFQKKLKNSLLSAGPGGTGQSIRQRRWRRHGNFSLPNAGVALGKEPFADKNFVVRSLPRAKESLPSAQIMSSTTILQNQGILL